MTTPANTIQSAPVLVTGASGFIGGRIAKLLQDRGTSVRAMCRGSSDRSYLAPKTDWVVGDIRSLDDVRRAVEGCSAIYHCAGFVGPTHYRLRDFDEINVGGTRNVMHAAAEFDVTKVVHTSSISAIGGNNSRLVDETAADDNLMRGYATSKRTSEQIALEGAAGNLEVVVINPAVVYGPRDRYFSRLIALQVNGWLRLIAFPDRLLPLVYIDDVANAHIAAMERGCSGHRYIIAPEAVRLDEFVATLASISGVRAPFGAIPRPIAKAVFTLAWGVSPITRFRPPLRLIDLNDPGPAYDGSKAVRELGITYTDLPEGLGVTVSWLRKRAISR